MVKIETESEIQKNKNVSALIFFNSVKFSCHRTDAFNCPVTPIRTIVCYTDTGNGEDSGVNIND